jgi:hypothetical protein
MNAILSCLEYFAGFLGALFNLFMIGVSGIFGIIEIPKYLRGKFM